MPKSRIRPRVKNRKVYSHDRTRKKGKIPKENLSLDQLDSAIKHSIEVVKLRLIQDDLRNLIVLSARSSDNMDHFIEIYKDHTIWLDNKVDEHLEICSIKMKLFLGKNADNYNLSVLDKQEYEPDKFHISSADLKNGYVAIENKETEELFAVILVNAPVEFPNDLISIGTIIPYDEKKLGEFKLESLLKNKDLINTILSRKTSILEGLKATGMANNWTCVSVSCINRKPKINFEDL